MTSRRKDKGKRLSVLTDAEKFALYGLPDFDEGQQLKYFSLTAEELATSRPEYWHRFIASCRWVISRPNTLSFIFLSPKDVYVAVDGQKFSVERPTIKARASKNILDLGRAWWLTPIVQPYSTKWLPHRCP